MKKFQNFVDLKFFRAIVEGFANCEAAFEARIQKIQKFLECLKFSVIVEGFADCETMRIQIVGWQARFIKNIQPISVGVWK